MLRKLAPSVALVVALLVPATASASTPAIYHTIEGRFAGAYFSSTDGCYQTDVWVSASSTKYAPQPGVSDKLNKQGLTSLSITVYDTCAPLEGKHYPAVADWFAQTSDELVTAPRLRSATLDALLPMTDGMSGATENVAVHLGWAATGVAHPHTARNNHLRFPGEGIVNTHDNNFSLSAIASGTVMLAGVNVAQGVDEGATLEQVKASCMEVGYPHWQGDTYFCFGF
jgi:hypothetical protein